MPFTISEDAARSVILALPAGYKNSSTRAADFSFAGIRAFAFLWGECEEHGGLLPATDLLDRLQTKGNKGDDGNELHLAAFRARALKLVQDFLRDAHTYALLSRFFASTMYKAEFDYADVDFVVRLTVESEPAGIQAAMWFPDRWDAEPGSAADFLALKRRRRLGRGETGFPGETFLLSNRTRREWESCNGVWLFKSAHIDDLISEMRNRGSLIERERANTTMAGRLFP